jgi:malate synthase
MDAFVVDLEDATVPEWKNIITAQKHLRDGVAGLNELSEISIIGLKPRALTGSDNNILIGDEPISSSLLDFGLFFFHNASRLLDKGSTPYLLLPKIESNCEARWWNQVFTFAQYHLGIPQGTIKASIVIDNILAGFQLHEILYELRDHAAGMTFEPFNYLQSIIRKFPFSMVLPSYRSLSVESAGLNAVRHLLIDTCRLRKSYALGLPMDMQQVNIDILAGYNGLRLTNTDFIEEILTLIQERDEEEIIRMEEYKVTDTDLLSFPKHPVSLEDFRANIRMSLIYLCEVHAGRGSTDVDGQQIDRSLAGLMIGQLWQWLHNTQKLETGEVVTRNLYQDILTSELEEIRAASGPGMDECLTSAVQQLDKLIVEKQFMDIYPAK